MKFQQQFNNQAEILKVLGHPARLAILEVIRDEEHCVCHIEAVLRKRQAYISQQLMVLREAGLITYRRVGLNKYYRLSDQSIMELIDTVSEFSNAAEKRINQNNPKSCLCPKCSGNGLAMPAKG